MGAGNVEVTVTYIANEDTAYTVEHYLQNILDDKYTKVEADTETKAGTTGEQTLAVAKTYTGFTAQKIEQQIIAGEGTTVVKIYYTRNSYELVYKVDDVQYGEKEIYKYGQEVTVRQAPTKEGYTFSGWTYSVGEKYGDTDYHTVVTIFEPDTERYGMPFDYVEELLSNPDNYELDIIRRQSIRKFRKKRILKRLWAVNTYKVFWGMHFEKSRICLKKACLYCT